MLSINVLTFVVFKFKKEKTLMKTRMEKKKMNGQFKRQKEPNTIDLWGDIEMRGLITLTGLAAVRKNDPEAGLVTQW